VASITGSGFDAEIAQHCQHFFRDRVRANRRQIRVEKINSPQQVWYSLGNRNPDVIDSHVSHKTAYDDLRRVDSCAARHQLISFLV
jgi:hypothetical protein